jgi:hypothetical protein
MKKSEKMLPIVMLTAALAHTPIISAAINMAQATAASELPAVMQSSRTMPDFSQPEELNLFSRLLVEKIQVSMPSRCEGDWDCYATQCGTGTFCGPGAEGDDSDATC